jgi:hypothetical protein
MLPGTGLCCTAASQAAIVLFVASLCSVAGHPPYPSLTHPAAGSRRTCASVRPRPRAMPATTCPYMQSRVACTCSRCAAVEEWLVRNEAALLYSWGGVGGGGQGLGWPAGMLPAGRSRGGGPRHGNQRASCASHQPRCPHLSRKECRRQPPAVQQAARVWHGCSQPRHRHQPPRLRRHHVKGRGQVESRGGACPTLAKGVGIDERRGASRGLLPARTSCKSSPLAVANSRQQGRLAASGHPHGPAQCLAPGAGDQLPPLA